MNSAFRNLNSNKFYQSVKTKTRELGFQPNYLLNENDRTNFGNKLDWEQKTKDVELLLSKKGLSLSAAGINPKSKKYLGTYTIASQVVVLEKIIDSGFSRSITSDLFVGMYVFGQGIKPETTIKKIQSGNRILLSQKPSMSRTGTIYFLEKNLYSGGDDIRYKKIKKSKNDSSLYLNITNYYESNNRFFDFVRNKSFPLPPPPTPTPTGYDIVAYFISDLYLDLSLVSTKTKLSDIYSNLDLSIDVESRRGRLFRKNSEINLNISFDHLGECIINGGKPNTSNFSFMLFGGSPNTENLISIEQWCNITKNNF